MAAKRNRLVNHICTLAGGGAATDRELLGRFAQDRDEDAFAALVRRHGALVLGTCERVLRSRPDAEDCSQAVFLSLAREATSPRWQDSVAGWLHRAAVHTALKAVAARTARRKVEAGGRVAQAPDPLAELSVRDLQAVLDEELARLPDRYRAPVLLCCLKGLARDEVAQRLGWDVGLVKSRLEAGRERLRRRLERRGVLLSAALAALTLAGRAGAAAVGRLAAGVPKVAARLLAGEPPTGFIPAAVAELIQGGTRTVSAAAYKITTAVCAAIGVIAAGFTVVSYGGPASVVAANPPGTPPPAPKADGNAELKPGEPKPQTIRGTVVGPDGKPLVADLSLVWQQGKSLPLGKTAADGTFKVTVPVAREHAGWLVATAPGCGPDFRIHGPGHPPHSLSTAAEITLKLPKERAIKGRVLDQQGKPVVGAAVAVVGLAAYEGDAPAGVSIEFAEAPDAGPVSPYISTTDKAGRFEISGVGAGQKIRLSVRGTGVADDAVVTVNRDGFDPAPVNQARNDFLKRFAVSGGDRTVWYGPDPTVVLEPEQVIRGRVTDPEGKPRAGVPVSFTRPNKNEVNVRALTAVTNRDGSYEIRGARKHRGYMVEVPPDPATGLLPCQGFAADTAGYEPITIDLKCARGVVVSGTVKDKATGLPVPSRMAAFVLPDNPFVEKYPPFLHAASAAPDQYRTDPDGRFRVVTIPGPVVLVAVPLNGEMEKYKPVVPDRTPANRFTTDGSPDGGPGFSAYGGRFVPLQGHWCRVIDAKPADKEVTAGVELEPAAKILVKVVDADGKPVPGTHATGVKIRDSVRPTEYPDTDALTVYNPEAKKDRLLTVVHKERKLVGTLLLTAGDMNPVVRLGPGGRVTGRAVDADGMPLEGLRVRAEFARPGVTAAFDALKDTEPVTTDANGEFTIDGLFPGQEFRLTASKGLKSFGPAAGALGHSIGKHGESLKLGDWKLKPTDGGN